ncbi:MAG: alpha/beta fold hydrolase [Cyanobacteria bacterium P01_A01_bin.135]
MGEPCFLPSLPLRSGLAMTLYTALWASRDWQSSIAVPRPAYKSTQFRGADGVPIWGLVAQQPSGGRGTVVGTYGITGDLDNQWFLRLMGRKALAAGYSVVLFDWRAHGKTAELSPALTSDGIYEGPDFVHIAAQARAMGCAAPVWFTGFSLGGQLALWGLRTAQSPNLKETYGIDETDIAGAAVICPSLESDRSLRYLEQAFLGRYLEQSIARTLQQLAQRLQQLHPQHIDPEAIAQANTIRQFDQHLVISKLGFKTTADYYRATSPLYFLPTLTKPTLILYAEDDPLFDPTLVAELKDIGQRTDAIDLMLTAHGGHVGYYLDSAEEQRRWGDLDPWWAWNRTLQWFERQSLG